MAQGATALSFDQRHGRAVNDLTVYLGQLPPRTRRGRGRAPIPATTGGRRELDGSALLDARLVVVAPSPGRRDPRRRRPHALDGPPRREVVVVAVTDGEASHASSDRVGAAELRDGGRRTDRGARPARGGRGDASPARRARPGLRRHESPSIAAAIWWHPRATTSWSRRRHATGTPTTSPWPPAARVPRPHRRRTVWFAPTWALVHGTVDPPTTLARSSTPRRAGRPSSHAVRAYRPSSNRSAPIRSTARRPRRRAGHDAAPCEQFHGTAL